MNDRPRFDPLDLLTIRQVMRLTKRSRSSIYVDIAAGRLRTVKLGGATRVPRVELERYISEGSSAK